MSARPPQLYSQLSVNDPQRANDCGECVDAELLNVGGVAATPADVITRLGHDGVTDRAELVSLLQRAGATVTAGVSWPALLAGVASGGWGLVLIRDDDAGNPAAAGTHQHWILPYALTADGAVRCCNSWPDAQGNARDLAYARAELLAAYEWGAVIDWPTSEDSAMAANITTYPGPDGQHLAYIDGAGHVFDGRDTGAGWDYGAGVNVKPGPEHAIFTGARPYGSIAGAMLGGVCNLWFTGALGDAVHLAFLNAAWTNQPS